MGSCLIVDDHPIVRVGLARVVTTCQPDWHCLEAGTLAEARQCLTDRRVDLVLLDMKLGQESGLQLLSWLTTHRAEIPALVLSMHDDLDLIGQAIEQGARGYLLKDLAAQQLEVAIRSVLAGKRYVPAELAQHLYFRKLESDGIGSLTSREWQVFGLLAEGLSKSLMAERLCLSPNTVETYRQRLRVKLGARDNLQLVRMAVRHFATAE